MPVIRKIHFLLCAFAIFFSAFLPTFAEATLDFSVVPVEGGSAIRFTRGDLNNDVTKEIRIRVTSDEQTQYQIFQQLISPFTNERGTTLDRPVLEASLLPGSTGSGTAYLTNYEPVNMGEQLVYTSSPNGMSESLTIVYHVQTQYLRDSGTFNGLVRFILRPVSGGQMKTVQANFFIDSNAELEFDAEGSAGKNLVRLDTNAHDLPTYVRLSFKGNAGNSLRIYQEVITYPINDLNLELESGILKLRTEGAQNGDLSYQSEVDLPRNRALIYKSSQQSDSFSTVFTLFPDRLAELMAGSYRGAVRFSFETDRDVKYFDINLEIKISPIFEIALAFPQGPINFDKVLPGGEPQVKSVEVEVKTNLRRPYVVKQKVSDLLVNEKGLSIPKKFFVFRQDVNEKSFGRPANSDFKPVQTEETEIFYSDKKGSPAKFIVFYRLSPFSEMTAGDYRTSIVYDLGEL